MQGLKGGILGRIKLTTTIAGMVLGAVVLSVGAVILAVYISLTANSAATALATQENNIRTAATILRGMGGIQVNWTEEGNIESIGTWVMPRFYNDEVVESISRVTGESAKIFTWDSGEQMFNQVSTSMRDAEGNIIDHGSIDSSSPVFERLVAGEAVFVETQVAGTPYYSVYQPISYLSGSDVLGVLYIGVGQDAITSVVTEAMSMLLIVGLIAIVAVGGLSFLASRAISRPIPKLSKVMNSIAANEFDVDVPYTQNKNEIGDMARAVEIFRQNGLKVAEMTEAEAARIIADEEARRKMMGELQSAFG